MPKSAMSNPKEFTPALFGRVGGIYLVNGTGAHNVPSYRFRATENSVISAITFSTGANVTGNWVGVTIPKGDNLFAAIQSITLSSGSGILYPNVPYTP